MEFAILGPLRVTEDGRAFAVGGKQRALLAILLLESGRVVSRERLIDELWGDEPPETAAKSVQVFASRLRKALPGVPLRTHGTGYVLDAGGRLDLDRHERLLAEARAARAAGEVERARELFGEALALWRGPALTDVDEDFARLARERLEEMRLATLEERLDCDLELGRHARVVPELEGLVQEHPLRERFRAQLMLALYRAGRQADALEAFRHARTALVDELGLEPGPELQRLERAILAQDVELDPPTRSATAAADRLPKSAERAERRRRLMAAALSAAAVAAVAAAIVAYAARGTDDAAPVEPRSLSRLDAESGATLATVPLAAHPSLVAAGGVFVWVSTRERTLVRLDRRTEEVVSTIALPEAPTGLAVGAGSAWVAFERERRLARVSPRYERIVARVPLPAPGGRLGLGPLAPRVLFGGGFAWVASGQTTVTKVDPRTDRVVGHIRPASGVSGALAYGAGSLWVAGPNAIARVSPSAKIVVSTIRLPSTPVALAFHRGSVWAALEAGTVVRLDAATETVERPISLDASPIALAVDDDRVWLSTARALLRIDPARAAVDHRIPTDATPTALVVAGNSIWVGGA